jgi:hypothetical protein
VTLQQDIQKINSGGRAGLASPASRRRDYSEPDSIPGQQHDRGQHGRQPRPMVALVLVGNLDGYLRE